MKSTQAPDAYMSRQHMAFGDAGRSSTPDTASIDQGACGVSAARGQDSAHDRLHLQQARRAAVGGEQRISRRYRCKYEC